MYDDPLDVREIETRVTERYQRRYRFILHSVIFFMGLIFFGPRMSVEAFFAWTVLWVLHFLWIGYRSGLEAAIRQEIEAERERYHKAKREEVFDQRRLHDPAYEGHDQDYPQKREISGPD
jgi:hypothetical protein